MTNSNSVIHMTAKIKIPINRYPVKYPINSKIVQILIHKTFRPKNNKKNNQFNRTQNFQREI